MTKKLFTNKNNICPLCGDKSARANRLPAVISPWIRDLGVKRKVSSYNLCKACSVGYFSYRYSQDEMTLIYRNYRGDKYQQIREKWESWYTKSYNSNHDMQEYILSRREAIRNFLLQYIDVEIAVIVDVGGDRGQYIPEIIGAKKFVLDPSEKQTIEGVERVKDLTQIESVDLILYSHVLEHVANPLLVIQDLVSQSKYLYLEVPFGLPEISKKRKNLFFWGVHIFCSFFPKLWSRRTAPSTSRLVNKHLTLTQSEHINFFSVESLQSMATKLGLNCNTQVQTVFTPDFSEGRVIQCILSRLG